MIKVNIKTNEATREGIPSSLIGLSNTTLQNLQTELKPVPTELQDIEFWPEVDVSPNFDTSTKKYEGETFELDMENKVVKVSRIVVSKTEEEIQADFIAKSTVLKEELLREISILLDNKAKEKGYDNIVSACSYAGIDNPFRTESEKFIVYRATVWSTCYSLLNEALTTKVLPTKEDVLGQINIIEL